MIKGSIQEEDITIINIYAPTIRASLVAQRLKHLPAMQETWVQSLGQEDPLEKVPCALEKKVKFIFLG